MKGERDAAARERVLAALRGGASASAAAKAAGVTRQAIYLWRARGDPELDALLSSSSAARYRKIDAPEGGRRAPPLPAVPPLPMVPPLLTPPPKTPFAPSGQSDEAFAARLRSLGLSTLVKVAQDAEVPAAARVAAARTLVEHGERFDAVLRSTRVAPPPVDAPAPERTAPVEAEPPKLTAEDAARRFRVVT